MAVVAEGVAEAGISDEFAEEAWEFLGAALDAGAELGVEIGETRLFVEPGAADKGLAVEAWFENVVTTDVRGERATDDADIGECIELHQQAHAVAQAYRFGFCRGDAGAIESDAFLAQHVGNAGEAFRVARHDQGLQAGMLIEQDAMGRQGQLFFTGVGAAEDDHRPSAVEAELGGEGVEIFG